MLESLKSFGEWLLKVVEHWEVIVVTGAIPFFIDMVDKFFDWKMPKKFYAVFVGIGLVLAMFKTWDDERNKNDELSAKLKQNAVYVVPQAPTVSPEALNDTTPLSVGREVRFNQAWQLVGSNPAFDVRAISYCYLADDAEESTQMKFIEESQTKWLANPTRKSKDGPTQFPNVNIFGSICTIAINEGNLNDIILGHKIIFVIGIARFLDAIGEHESHACTWFKPPPVSAPNKFVGIGWNECKKFTTQVNVEASEK